MVDALSRNPQAPALPEQDTEQDIQVAQVLGSNQEESGDGFLQLLQLDPSPDHHDDIGPPLAEEQRRDDSLRPLIQYLEDSRLPDNPALARKIAAQSTQFTLLGGILYFINQKKNSRKRAVVPVQLRTTLIEGVHGGPLARHFSSQRVFNTLSRTWWWEGMYHDVHTHCKSCPQCAVVVGGSRPGRPPLKLIPVSRPF